VSETSEIMTRMRRKVRAENDASFAVYFKTLLVFGLDCI
jgi:hypothetical protein